MDVLHHTVVDTAVDTAEVDTTEDTGEVDTAVMEKAVVIVLRVAGAVPYVTLITTRYSTPWVEDKEEKEIESYSGHKC